MTRSSNAGRQAKKADVKKKAANIAATIKGGKNLGSGIRRKILSPVDEDEENSTEASVKENIPKTRPTCRAATKVSYEEMEDDDEHEDDDKTEPESSDEEEKIPDKKQRKTTLVQKVSKTAMPVSPKRRNGSMRRPSPLKKKSNSSVVKNSSPLLAVSVSPANVTHDMWKPNETDWRVADAMDY